MYLHSCGDVRAEWPIDAPINPAMYGRLFPIPAFNTERELLSPIALGRARGLCDSGDEADEPVSLASVTAGWPFFSRLVAHDITANRSGSRGGHEKERRRIDATDAVRIISTMIGGGGR